MEAQNIVLAVHIVQFSTFARRDDMKRHIKKKHPEPVVTKGFCCGNCKKPFQYELALHLHEERCGKEKPKPFKCIFAGCGKCFIRKSTLEHHQQHYHLSQLGGDIKRKLEEEDQTPTLPKKMKDIPKPDRETSAKKGDNVDSFFYPKTEGQKADQQVFFKQTLPRLEARLKNALQEKY